MKEWHFNVLFVMGVIALFVFLFGSKIGITVEPEVVTVFGTMLAFLYTQKRDKKEKDDDKQDEEASR